MSMYHVSYYYSVTWYITTKSRDMLLPGHVIDIVIDSAKK